jgi:hypothetical protein
MVEFQVSSMAQNVQRENPVFLRRTWIRLWFSRKIKERKKEKKEMCAFGG